MAHKLTKAQYEVIYEIRVNQGYEPGTLFRPLEVFPERDNRDNGCRRTLRNLANKTSLVIRERNDQFRLTDEAVTVMNDYHQKEDRKSMLRMAERRSLVEAAFDDGWGD
jgi:hypothetical protein